MAGVRMEKLNKVYPNGVHAVRDFTLEVGEREFVVLVGPSGCGKSTLLRMVAGLESITQGELWMGERQINQVRPKDRDLAMVFQNYALYPHMTVFDNMALGLKLRHVPKKQIRERVGQAARWLDVADLLERKPGQLSGGQQQRVALGRAMVRQPSLFLLDEPLSNLDAKMRGQMRYQIIRLHKAMQKAFLYVTHDQTEAMTMADRIVVMREGEIMQADTPGNLYHRPANLFVAGFIGTPQMNFFDCTLENRGGMLALVGAGFCWPLEGSSFSFQELENFIGTDLVLGVRCSDVKIRKEGSHGARVDFMEDMGGEILLHLSFAGGEFVAKISPEEKPDAPEVAFDLDMSKIHLFHKQTGKALKQAMVSKF